jgi:hypothetical protein
MSPYGSIIDVAVWQHNENFWMIFLKFQQKLEICEFAKCSEKLQLGTLQIPENFKLLLYRNGE